MKEAVSKTERALKQIREELHKGQKDLKAISNALDKGDFSKFGQIVNDNRFAGALKSLGVESLLNEIRNKYSKHMTGLRMEFDAQFISLCNSMGLQDIKGNSMKDFHIRGILRLRINFQKNVAEIRTFVKSYKIRSLDPSVISEELKREFNRLFNRPFDPKDFLVNLFKAYQRMKTDSMRPILLREVHKFLWTAKQKDEFFDTSDPKKLLSYPLDEFSVDLGRLLESEVQTLDNKYSCKLSLGSGGINIYQRNGEFNAYKYIEFVRRENHA